MLAPSLSEDMAAIFSKFLPDKSHMTEMVLKRMAMPLKQQQILVILVGVKTIDNTDVADRPISLIDWILIGSHSLLASFPHKLRDMRCDK